MQWPWLALLPPFVRFMQKQEQTSSHGAGRQQVAVAGKEKATLVRTFAVSGRESAEEAIYLGTFRVQKF